MKIRRAVLIATLLAIPSSFLFFSAPQEPQEIAPQGRHVSASSSPTSPSTTLSRRGAVPNVSDAALPGETFIAGQVMIRPAPGEGLLALAERYQIDIIRPLRESGLAVVSTPPGWSEDAFLAHLRQRDEIVSGSRHARIVGAGRGSGQRISDLQWHLEDISSPRRSTPHLADVVVAVLDTGVAYQSGEFDGQTHVAIDSLSRSEIVAPWDFVNDDEDALDDHQHGTHIASLIASHGQVRGVAPGVSLMPLKVLDADNLGYEADLIEAIHHAVDSGADIINMSLAFGADYVPGAEMLAALQEAHDHEVLMGAAAGNQSLSLTSWPAAAPQVIAVGGHCLSGLAVYTHAAAGVDLTAPSGCLDEDANGDGHQDGIIAETIGIQDPSQTGYWAWAGTSQATAQVSGTLAQMLALGTQPRAARWTMLYATTIDLGGFEDGAGAGRLDVRRAMALGRYLGFINEEPWQYGVSMMPYLVDNGEGTVSPATRLTLKSRGYLPTQQVTAYVRFSGATEETRSCTLRPGSHCTIIGTAIEQTDEDGEDAALWWGVSIETLVNEHLIPVHPDRVLFATPDLLKVIDAIEHDGSFSDALPAFYWESGEDAVLGELSESLVILDSGAGISTSPFGLLMTPSFLAPHAEIRDITLEGGGISTSPFGLRLLEIPEFDAFSGTGISTSPFGLRLFMLGGTGISTSPFGVREVLSPDNPDDAAAIWLGQKTIENVQTVEDLEDSALQARIQERGWRTPTGNQGASELLESTVVGEAEEARVMDIGEEGIEIEL